MRTVELILPGPDVVVRTRSSAIALDDRLATYVEARQAEFPRIDAERRELLEELARGVREGAEGDAPVQLLFVCTHNSRRSHFAQIWAWVAARLHGLDRVRTFSGGTEVTAFEPRAMAALERAGLELVRGAGTDNPRHVVRLRPDDDGLAAFSKVFDDAMNPARDFTAVMTCSHADQNCPVVPSADRRLAITYEDPKRADGTDEEREVYDASCRRIAREMLYAFGRAVN